MMIPFSLTRNKDNDLKYWHGTDSKVVDLVEGEKLRHLVDSRYKTHRRRPTWSGSTRLRLLAELLLNMRHKNWHHWLNWRIIDPNSIREWPTWNQQITQYLTHDARGVSCSRVTATFWHTYSFFPFPQPYGWVLFSCLTSSREITGAWYKLILRTSPPKYV